MAISTLFQLTGFLERMRFPTQFLLDVFTFYVFALRRHTRPPELWFITYFHTNTPTQSVVQLFQFGRTKKHNHPVAVTDIPFDPTSHTQAVAHTKHILFSSENRTPKEVF